MSNVEQKHKKITNRSFYLILLFVIFVFLIIFKLVHIQYIEGNKYRLLAKKYTIKEFEIKANRGNIYSEDGNLLATSVPKYDIAINPQIPSEKDFYNHIDGLCRKLSLKTGISSQIWRRKLVSARKKGKAYVRLLNSITYQEYQEVKKYPLFHLGIYKSGLQPELKTQRTYPLGEIMRRTIGFDRGNGNGAGIEGAYASYLRGKNGIQKRQKIQYGVWKPISDINEVEPRDGYDVITNIDVDIQDMAHQLLFKTLMKYEASHGSLVVMETKTGAIKSIVNLGRTSSGNYKELRNYAVFETVEPGSTFKLFSVMALLEDKLADTSDVVNTGNGIYKIYNKSIRDAHHGSLGQLTLKQVFEKSSNIGVVKLVYDNYKNQPKKFVNRLYNFGIHEKSGIDIKGEGTPVIPSPDDNNWSGISLPWMAYGYGVEMTNIQILTFYNAIANGGKVMKPYLVKAIKSFDKKIKTFQPEIINSSLASDETIKKMQVLLRGVVERGTAMNINSPFVTIAGKTGTAQTDYWKGNVQYISSFVGYFPAENPKYSMIVVINKPNPEIGYYGNMVAAPVFKELAEYIYGKMPIEIDIALQQKMVKKKDVDKILDKYKTIMPDVRGLQAKDALYVLENLGLKVKLIGRGMVKQQSIPRGTKIKKNQNVELRLS